MRRHSWAAATERNSPKAIRHHQSDVGQASHRLRTYAFGCGWSRASRIAGSIGLLFVIPFIIILVAALFGLGIEEVPDIASWVMGALTAIGALGLFAAIINWVRNRHIDWFWLFVTGSAFAFWGSVFLESLN